MLFAFADRLRQLRHKKNYTLGMLADRLSQKNVSVGQAALGKYEAGRIYPILHLATFSCSYLNFVESILIAWYYKTTEFSPQHHLRNKENRMYYKRFFALALLALQLIVLSACNSANGNTSQSTTMNNKPPEDDGNSTQELGEQETSDTMLLTSFLGSDRFLFLDEGFYQAMSNPKGGCNILYTEYQSKATIYLCSQLNCTHDNDSCTSWFPASMVSLFSNANHDVLYYIMDNGNGSQLWQSNVSGQDRKLVYQGGSTEEICEAIAGDEHSFYFSVRLRNTSDESPSGAGLYKELSQVSLESGKRKALLEYPEPTWLFGAYDHTLLLLYYEEPSFVYRTYNMQTNTLSDLYTYSVDEKGMGSFARPYGRDLYIFEPTDESHANFVKMDMETQETQVLITDFPYYGSETTSISGMYDSCMSVFVRKPETREKEHYLIDCQTGTYTLIDLAYQPHDISIPVDIYASAGDYYVVNCGFTTYPLVLQSDDGTSYTMESTGVSYALIKKSDYWNNIPNYIEIDTSAVNG